MRSIRSDLVGHVPDPAPDEPANTINSQFAWHDFYAELIRLTGSSSHIEHKDLDAITDDELPNKGFYAQTWRYSGERLK